MKSMKLCLILIMITGCAAAAVTARPAAYDTELDNCNKQAATYEESVACENKVRAKYNRQARDGGTQ